MDDDNGYMGETQSPGARNPEAHLFPGYAECRGQWGLKACWSAVCEGAKLGRLRLHDRRHTAAGHAVMSGENLPLVGKLLGHRRYRTTASYAHFADEHVVAAAERVGVSSSKRWRETPARRGRFRRDLRVRARTVALPFNRALVCQRRP